MASMLGGQQEFLEDVLVFIQVPGRGVLLLHNRKLNAWVLFAAVTYESFSAKLVCCTHLGNSTGSVCSFSTTTLKFSQCYTDFYSPDIRNEISYLCFVSLG